MNNKRLRPNIVRGGVAIPIPNKNNYYYMKGRKHEQGGIDIGKDPRTGLEVEDGEVMHISPTEVKVFSSVPFLNGESPAEKVIKGNNPNEVFNAQERYKDVNNINDDGTKNNKTKRNKSRFGSNKSPFAIINKRQSLANNVSTLENPIISPNYTPNYDNTEVGKLINYSENPDSIGFDKDTRRWYSPKGKGLDKNNFGMGVDRYTGGNISDKIKKDSKGREYITEEDERDLRFKRIKSANQSAKRRIDFIRKYYNDEGDVTETKEALLTNLIYNRGSGRTAREYFNPEDKKYVPMQKAILRGTDDEVREEINKIYKEAGLANRDSLVNNFYEKRNKTANIKKKQFSGENNNIQYIYEKVNKKYTPDFVRLKDPNRKSIDDWNKKGYTSTNKIAVGTDENGQDFIYNNIQDDDKGGLIDMTNPKNFKNGKYVGDLRAIERGDTVQINSIKDGLIFSKNYKNYYKGFNKKRMGGLSRSKDYGSKSKPYPNVGKKDFAGKNRSYPIPTKADAVDALRLAGLHGRDDIKTKVYNKYPELRKRAKNGGVYTLTSNGKTSLRMIPSTGERIKFKNGGIEDIEKTVTLIPEIYSLGLKDELSNKINQPIVNYHTPVEEIKYDILDTKGRFNPIIGVDLNTKRDYDNRNNIMKKRGYNSLISDGIGIASNIIGSIIGFNANKKALDKMKYTKAPVNLIPSKLKTNININPQLDAIRDQQQAYERQIDANTASSRVALGRKQLSRLNTIKLLNNIYTNKENTETELINKDKLNQQAVVNQNITNYNTWKEKKNAFENAIIEKQSENTIGLINSINAGVQNSIGNFEKRLGAENNIRAIAAANPNVNPIILKALGVRGITNDMIESWLRAYGNKNN